MAPRARLAWSDIRDSYIRVLLQEITSTASFWSDANLLMLANLAIDKRVVQMLEMDEGWFVRRSYTNLVKNQDEYTLEEGTDGIRRILIAYPIDSSTTEDEIPIQRDERYDKGVYKGTSGGTGWQPSYRLLSELLYLDPAPPVSKTAGLVIEYESLPARLTGDASKVDLAFPSMFETLLVYDVVELAFAMEESMGEPVERDEKLKMIHLTYEHAFLRACRRRSYGHTYATPFYLGD